MFSDLFLGKPNDIREAPFVGKDETPIVLNAVTARLVQRLTACDIFLYKVLAEFAKNNRRTHCPARTAFCRKQAPARKNFVPFSAQRTERPDRVVSVGRFAENAPLKCDHGIRAKHRCLRILRKDAFCLSDGERFRRDGRRQIPFQPFIRKGRHYPEISDQPREDLFPARRRARKYQFHSFQPYKIFPRATIAANKICGNRMGSEDLQIFTERFSEFGVGGHRVADLQRRVSVHFRLHDDGIAQHVTVDAFDRT